MINLLKIIIMWRFLKVIMFITIKYKTNNTEARKICFPKTCYITINYCAIARQLPKLTSDSIYYCFRIKKNN